MTDLFDQEQDHLDRTRLLFAEVILPLALPKTLTWQVPSHLNQSIKPGCRVEVNLGKSKKYAGVVKRISQESPGISSPKQILNLIDEEPVVYPLQLQLWKWMADYYMCSEGEVMAAALPAHFKLSSETILIWNDEYGDDFSLLDHDEYLVAEALLIKKEIRLTEVQQILDVTHVYPVINRLISKKVCFVWEALKKTYTPKKENFVILESLYTNEKELEKLLNEDAKWKRAEKQMELLLAYLHLSKTEGEVTRTALLKKSGASDAQLKGLVTKGVLRIEKREVDRLHFLPKDIQIDFELSAAQQKSFVEIQESFIEKQVCLLHGITSSGKTQIYIKLIEQYIRSGKQVLYLLPEIALTGQIIRRLQKHFGGFIGIYHSKFSQNERVEIWNKVKTGEMKIVLGARSSVFLPFNDLGFIICDEEHDSSYKQQEPAPRYHGRDVGIYLASLFKAKVLLGSATPSLESYYNAQQKKYGLVELMQRFGDLPLPDIEIADLRSVQLKKNETLLLMPAMIKAINDVLDNQKQVILFQNRRGYSPYQVCNTCGWIPQCRQCDVSLTFHKFANRLVCHYCGTGYTPVSVCEQCGNHDFSQRKFGTERIEEHLQELFPKARIGRMDMDTVRGKHAHEVLIQQFEQHRIDILVGTQMVVKGLDFEKVDLVGIVDADGLLHFAEFRVHERAFQLMEQVSGRTGRKEKGGKVLIQTRQPNHPVLQYVKLHDYKKFYEDEIKKREQFFYPPFSRIIRITFRHKIKETVAAAAIHYANGLQSLFGKYITGPAEPTVNRVRNQYLMELMLKLPKDKDLLLAVKKEMHRQLVALHAEKRFKSVVVIPDVDII